MVNSLIFSRTSKETRWIALLSLLSLATFSSCGEPKNAQLYGNKIVNLSAQEKLDYLWGEIERTDDYIKNGHLSRWSSSLPAILFANMTRALTLDEEYTEKKRGASVKVIHQRAVVGKIRFESTSQPKMTGFFKNGSQNGLIRLSLAFDPGKGGIIPGVGLKFLVDGQASANAHLMDSISTLDSRNFFELELRNSLDTLNSPIVDIVISAFKRASSTVDKLAVDRFAQVDEQGQAYPQALVPARLMIRAPKKLIDRYQNHPLRKSGDFRELMIKELQKGDVLYEVYASRFKSSQESFPFNEQEIHVGRIVLDSRLISSQFGDEHLFFKHQDWEKGVHRGSEY